MLDQLLGGGGGGLSHWRNSVQLLALVHHAGSDLDRRSLINMLVMVLVQHVTAFGTVRRCLVA